MRLRAKGATMWLRLARTAADRPSAAPVAAAVRKAIRDCDVIVVIEDDAIAEHGSHEALMRRDGLYAQQAAI